MWHVICDVWYVACNMWRFSNKIREWTCDKMWWHLIRLQNEKNHRQVFYIHSLTMMPSACAAATTCTLCYILYVILYIIRYIDCRLHSPSPNHHVHVTCSKWAGSETNHAHMSFMMVHVCHYVFTAHRTSLIITNNYCCRRDCRFSHHAHC